MQLLSCSFCPVIMFSPLYSAGKTAQSHFGPTGKSTHSPLPTICLHITVCVLRRRGACWVYFVNAVCLEALIIDIRTVQRQRSLREGLCTEQQYGYKDLEEKLVHNLQYMNNVKLPSNVKVVQCKGWCSEFSPELPLLLSLCTGGCERIRYGFLYEKG